MADALQRQPPPPDSERHSEVEQSAAVGTAVVESVGTFPARCRFAVAFVVAVVAFVAIAIVVVVVVVVR